MKDYKYFEKKLNDAKDDKELIKICLDGIFNNLFYRHSVLLNSLNIETLKIRYPELYETIADENVKKALVVSEMFKVKDQYSIMKKVIEKKGVEPELEIELEDYTHNPAFPMIGTPYEIIVEDKDKIYSGKDAVKVFMKSIYILGQYLNKILWEPVLADPWRTAEGFEKERDDLKNMLLSIVNDKKGCEEFVYSLYHHYKNVLLRSRVKKKIEKFLEIKIS